MRRLVAFAVVAFLFGDAAAFAGPYEDTGRALRDEDARAVLRRLAGTDG